MSRDIKLHKHETILPNYQMKSCCQHQLDLKSSKDILQFSMISYRIYNSVQLNIFLTNKRSA